MNSTTVETTLAPAPYEEGKRTHTLRILVVDDHIDQALTLEKLLSRDGHRVLALSNSTKAIQLAPAFMPHVAILDMSIPILSGPDLCLHFKGQPWAHNTHMIAVSGHADGLHMSERAHFDAFFPKPIDWPRMSSLLAMLPP